MTSSKQLWRQKNSRNMTLSKHLLSHRDVSKAAESWHHHNRSAVTSSYQPFCDVTKTAVPGLCPYIFTTKIINRAMTSLITAPWRQQSRRDVIRTVAPWCYQNRRLSKCIAIPWSQRTFDKQKTARNGVCSWSAAAAQQATDSQHGRGAKKMYKRVQAKVDRVAACARFSSHNIEDGCGRCKGY